MRKLLTFAALCLPCPAQGILDLLDGETLYEGGSLVTFGLELDRGDKLRRGTDTVADPAHGHEWHQRSTLAWQYGLRNNLQLGVALPFVRHEQLGAAGELDSDGLGDLTLLGKYRFYRWDAPGVALNCALLGELSLPTGDDDTEAGGARLEPDLQPGSGSVDPSLGIAATHEPGRWRFNAAILQQWKLDTDGDDSSLGDAFVAEAAIGNRFWLEPYPGPFMRLDLIARYYREGDGELQGNDLDDGSQRATIGLNWAFRPQPALDFQFGIEVPFWQDVDGTRYGDDFGIDFTFGYRF